MKQPIRLAISTNIAVLLMTAFVLQAHIYNPAFIWHHVFTLNFKQLCKDALCLVPQKWRIFPIGAVSGVSVGSGSSGLHLAVPLPFKTPAFFHGSRSGVKCISSSRPQPSTALRFMFLAAVL